MAWSCHRSIVQSRHAFKPLSIVISVKPGFLSRPRGADVGGNIVIGPEINPPRNRDSIKWLRLGGRTDRWGKNRKALTDQMWKLISTAIKSAFVSYPWVKHYPLGWLMPLYIKTVWKKPAVRETALVIIAALQQICYLLEGWNRLHFQRFEWKTHKDPNNFCSGSIERILSMMVFDDLC